MKCKYCKYNQGPYCSAGVYETHGSFFAEHQQELGCAGGKLNPNLSKEEKEAFTTKDDILKAIDKAIEKYDEENMLVDVIFWKSIYNKIAEYLI